MMRSSKSSACACRSRALERREAAAAPRRGAVGTRGGRGAARAPLPRPRHVHAVGLGELLLVRGPQGRGPGRELVLVDQLVLEVGDLGAEAPRRGALGRAE